MTTTTTLLQKVLLAVGLCILPTDSARSQNITHGLGGLRRIVSLVSVDEDLRAFRDSSVIESRATLAIRRAFPENASINETSYTEVGILEFKWTAIPIPDFEGEVNRFAIAFSCGLSRVFPIHEAKAEAIAEVWSSGGVRVWGTNQVRQAMEEDVDDCVTKVVAAIIKNR